MIHFRDFISFRLRNSIDLDGRITQEELAEALHRDQPYVSKRLKDGNWTIDEYKQLSKILKSNDIYTFAVGLQVEPVIKKIAN